jgi:hypothetical protein
MSDEQKNYAAGFWVREKKFNSGKSILSVSGDTEKFCAWLRSITDERGGFKIGISPRKEVSDKGISHTCWQDTWKPTARDAVEKKPDPVTAQREKDKAVEDQDTMPF